MTEEKILIDGEEVELQKLIDDYRKKKSGVESKAKRKYREAGRLLGIELLDHLILSIEGYYSFSEEGLL